MALLERVPSTGFETLEGGLVFRQKRSAMWFPVCAMALASLGSAQDVYVIGGPTGELTGSSTWGWDGPLFEELRQNLEDADNFGFGGTIETPIRTNDIRYVSLENLRGLDAFIVPSWSDATMTQDQIDAILDFFFSGGDLIVLTDDDRHDLITETLGVPTGSLTAETMFDGFAPLCRGPFGVASSPVLSGNRGTLDPADIHAAGGHVAGQTNVGEVVVARWNPGAFGPRCGALVIATDIAAICDYNTDFATGNANAVYALNMMALLAQREPVTVIGGPASTLTGGSGTAAWQGGSSIAAFRSALEDGALFGATGTESRRIYTEDLSVIDDESLQLIDTFVATNWKDTDNNATMTAAILRAHGRGLNLMLFTEGSDSDRINAQIGVPTADGFQGAHAMALAPANDEVFGVVSGILVDRGGHLPTSDVVDTRGVCLALNSAGEAAVGYFPPHATADMSGSLLLTADVDVITSATADFDTMDENARFALNAVAYALRDRIAKVGGPGRSKQSGTWSWSGSYLEDLRVALEDSTKFGPQGLMKSAVVETVDLDEIDPVQLAKLDAFFTGWWTDVNVSDADLWSLDRYFRTGGGLAISQDDHNHDPIGQWFGLAARSNAGGKITGEAPLFDGPFGSPAEAVRSGYVSHLDASDVAAKFGTVAALGSDGEIASAIWEAEQFTTGTGPMWILGDTDLVTDANADYAALNDNAKFALNGFAWMLEGRCDAPFEIYGRGIAGAGGILPRIDLEGCPRVGSEVVLLVRDVVGGARGQLFISPHGRDSVPFGEGEFLVRAPFFSMPVVFSGPEGQPGAGCYGAGVRLPIDEGLIGLTVAFQTIAYDSAAAGGFSATAGLEFTIGE